LIEADSFCSVGRWDTLGGVLDAWIVHQPSQVVLPVLEGASHETALARDRLEAEVVVFNHNSVEVIFVSLDCILYIIIEEYSYRDKLIILRDEAIIY
jgi:hypothetical protein